jgi:hypothetical protein
MRYVTTRQATRLTGLSTAKLREWTSRRALIPSDVPPKSQGSPAKYSWQTILLLRVAAALRNRFHLELQAHQTLFLSLRVALRGKSFIALWDKRLVLYGTADWSVTDEADISLLRDDALVIRLNPHLAVLAEGFALPNPVGAVGQLDFFPATAVARVDESASRSKSANRGVTEKRRRWA